MNIRNFSSKLAPAQGGTSEYRRTSNYWIALDQKTSVYRGTQGSGRSVWDPNENLRERLSSCRSHLASLVSLFLMLSTNCEIKIQIVVIQYLRSSISTGPTVSKKARYTSLQCFCFFRSISQVTPKIIYFYHQNWNVQQQSTSIIFHSILYHHIVSDVVSPSAYTVEVLVKYRVLFQPMYRLVHTENYAQDQSVQKKM